jgi:hypothetical protein
MNTKTVIAFAEHGRNTPSAVVLKEALDTPGFKELTLLDLEEPYILEEFEACSWGHAQTYLQAKYFQTIYSPPDPIVWLPWDEMHKAARTPVGKAVINKLRLKKPK